MKSQLDSVRKTFDESAKTKDRVLAIHFTDGGHPVDAAIYDAIYERINSLVEFAPEDDVLEVGAGSGLLLERIARRVRKAYGTDISAGVLELVPPASNVELQQMDSDALRFADASFDKVVLNAVIQLFPDKDYARRCVAEMVRVCRPGGFVYIGDIFNAYLEKEYLHEARRPLTLRERAEKLARHLLGRDPGGYDILFLFPHQLHSWATALGCRDCRALLEVDEVKPYLFRKYRFDFVIRK
ncbi:MAG TPA: class I SAM-dependent methyltransferase [Vicinamibacteria bacterium]|nr:class I SAM-dependent methyltransferase [Vicinamibacteria bacterium]